MPTDMRGGVRAEEASPGTRLRASVACLLVCRLACLLAATRRQQTLWWRCGSRPPTTPLGSVGRIGLDPRGCSFSSVFQDNVGRGAPSHAADACDWRGGFYFLTSRDSLPLFFSFVLSRCYFFTPLGTVCGTSFLLIGRLAASFVVRRRPLCSNCRCQTFDFILSVVTFSPGIRLTPPLRLSSPLLRPFSSFGVGASVVA